MLQKDVQTIKLISALLLKEKDPTYLARVIYKLAVIKTKYEEIHN